MRAACERCCAVAVASRRRVWSDERRCLLGGSAACYSSGVRQRGEREKTLVRRSGFAVLLSSSLFPASATA